MSESLQQQLDEMAAELLDRYEELTLLYELGGALASVFEVDEIARIALERAARAVAADRAGVFLVGPDGLDAVAEHGGGVGTAAAGRVVETGRELLLHEGDELPGGGRAETPILSVPLLLPADQGVIGALTIVGVAGSRFTAGHAKLTEAVSRLLASAIYRSRAIDSLRASEAVRQELDIAAGIQRSLLPAAPPEVRGVELAALCVAAANVGGDYYDFVADDDGSVSLVIADVAGHSIGSALMMAIARSILRRELSEGAHPAAVLAATNAATFDDLVRSGLFITAFCARYDPRTGRLEYANAGHNLPLLHRRAAAEIAELDADGASLGILRDVEFEQGEVVLEPGDGLLLYTDGVTEAAAPDGEQFGEERLRSLVDGRGPAALAAAVYAAVRDHVGPAGHGDDVTLVALRAGGEA
jgi:sigma-B regulation protein RsbU (phosphoserine phosphatase)